MDLGVRGRRALVGGASKGLGLACAQALAAEGAEVILVSRSKENLDRAADSLPPGSTAHTIKARSEREGKSPAEIGEAITASLPQGRFQDPAELGALVAFLASEKASAITGAAIPAEGGMLKGIW